MVLPARLNDSFVCGSPPSPQSKPFSLGTEGSIDSKGIKAYPNPVRDNLYISGLSGIDSAEIVLYDLQGREILSKTNQANSDNTQLDISALENGVYLLQVSSAEEVLFVKRVVKE